MSGDERMIRETRVALLQTAAETILSRPSLRWTSRGYGYYNCTSCGAQMIRDEFTGQERAEPCSSSCPWRLLAEAAAAPRGVPPQNVFTHEDEPVFTNVGLAEKLTLGSNRGAPLTPPRFATDEEFRESAARVMNRHRDALEKTADPVRPHRQRSIELLNDTLAMLCHYVWHKQLRPGDHMWTIPVDQDRDFDCIFSDAIDELEQLRAAGLRDVPSSSEEFRDVGGETVVKSAEGLKAERAFFEGRDAPSAPTPIDKGEQ